VLAAAKPAGTSTAGVERRMLVPMQERKKQQEE